MFPGAWVPIMAVWSRVELSWAAWCPQSVPESSQEVGGGLVVGAVLCATAMATVLVVGWWGRGGLGVVSV